MKKEKIAGMALMVMNIALIAAGIALYLSMDRKEPSFEFQAMDIIYEVTSTCCAGPPDMYVHSRICAILPQKPCRDF